MSPFPQTTHAQQDLVIRDMAAADLRRCIWVRTQTRENRWSLEALTEAGVTEAAFTQHLATTHRGWVGVHNGQIVGFSMGDRSNGELLVVAVLPDYEGCGIGRRLVELVQQWLYEQGWHEIWLWTSPNYATRAYKLYRTLGWNDCGVTNDQLIMRRCVRQDAMDCPGAG